MSAEAVSWSARRFTRPRSMGAEVPRITTLAFGAFAGGVGVVGLVLVLTINVAMTQGAFEEAALKSEVRSIEAAQQRSQQTLAMLAAPGNLESRARAMGMVPATTPVFLRLADGRVIGDPRPATYESTPDAVRTLMPTQEVLAPDLQTAPAATKAKIIAPTSDAAVELDPGRTP